MIPAKEKVLMWSAVLLPGAAALFLAAWFYLVDRRELGLGFPIDDAYIFKRYAENLAAGAGFSFNPGEPSFGVTSLFWPALMSVLMKLFPFLDYVTLAFWAGALAAALACSLTAWLVIRETERAELGLAAGLMAALCPLVYMNGVSGMETGISMLLTAGIGVALFSERTIPWLPGALAGLFTINRPEALYFALAYPAGAIIASFSRKKMPRFRELLFFFLPFFALVLPAALFIRGQTGNWLPGTYLGKIMSASPGVLEWGFLQRFSKALAALAGGLMGPLSYLFYLAPFIGLLALLEAGLWWRRIFQRKKEEQPAAGRAAFYGFIFLPAAYGFFFPIGPAFGGYYLRYLAGVFLVLVIGGTLGFYRSLRFFAERSELIKTWKRAITIVFSVTVSLYMFWIARFQVPESLSVFRREVSLNTGLRMEAARWLKKHTEPDAVVMVGYTGLGVVGGECGRYVLDLGALINPDILDYYWRSGAAAEERWRMVVKYMKDRGADYYVTFPAVGEFAGKIPDPGTTPGFREVARLGKDPPRSPYDQIRIYRLNLE